MSQQFWRLDRVKEETGLTTSAVYEGMADGSFPKNFPVTRRSVAWLSDDIQAWKKARLAAVGRTMEAA